MKAILFAAAISVSGIAIAQSATTQDTNTTATQPRGDTNPDATATQPPVNQDATSTATQTTTTSDQDTNTTATEPTTQPSGQTVDDPSQATGPQGVTQQGTDPNGQATAPAGTNMPPSTMPAGSGQAAFAPRAAAGEYPPCSRTVTDNCVQTYERGVRRGARPRR